MNDAMIWFLPTLGRPEKMTRMIKSLSEGDRAEKVCVAYWKGDLRLRHYKSVPFPSHWEHHVTDCEILRDKQNWFYSTFPDLPAYGGISDDIVLETPDILRQWREATGPWEMTWCIDGWPNQTVASHGVVGAALAHAYVRAAGGLAHPQFTHFGTEMMLFQVAQELNFTKFLPHLQYDSPHPMREGMLHIEDDETHRKNRMGYILGQEILAAFPDSEIQRIIDCVRAEYLAGTYVPTGKIVPHYERTADV